MEHFTWDLFEKFDWEDFIYSQQITPRQFLRQWLGIDNLPELEIQKIESRRGYRARAVRLIASVLSVDEHVVDVYGKGVEFERMPERNRQRLAIALLARKYQNNLTKVQSAA